MDEQRGRFDLNGLILLFFTGLSERAIYYSFRSIFVLYLIDTEHGLGLSDIDASANYQFMFIVMIMAILCAGPLIDFVVPKKLQLPISFIFMGIGLLLCLYKNETTFTTGIVLLGLGSSLTRVSFYTKLDTVVRQIPERRNLAFVSFATFSNIPAFLLPLGIFNLAQRYNFKIAILAIALLCLLSLVLSLLIKSKTAPALPEMRKLKTPQRLGLVSLAALLSFSFWLTYDLNFNSLYEQVMLSFRETTAVFSLFTISSFHSLSSAVSIVISIIWIVVFILIANAPTLKLIALSTFLLIFAYRIFYLISPIDIAIESDIYGLLAVFVLSGIAEAIFAPLISAYVLKTAPEKYKAVFFSIFLFATSSITFFSVRLQEFIGRDYVLLLISLPTVFIAVAIVYAEKQIERRNTNLIFPPQHPQE